MNDGVENEIEREPDGGPSRAYDPRSGGFLRTPRALIRIAGAAYWRSARWTLKATTRTGKRMMRAAVNGQQPADVFRSTRAEMREQARRFLGIPEEPPTPEEMTAESTEAEREEARRTLRDRGAELLRRSRDVNFEEDAHPAYARILDQLAPDEGRILRLLKEQGPQPSVDIRSGLVPLKATSELVASGLHMIGAEAGCRHLDDVPAYLNNLFRLGLVWFSSEPLADPLRYQVLEAQPEVAEAMREAGRARSVRRSIGLTPFGRDFCDLCLPPDEIDVGPPTGSADEIGEPDAGKQGNGAGGSDSAD